MERKEAKGAGFLIPCVTLVAGVYWLYASMFEMEVYDQNGPQTGFFPAIVAVILILVSLILLVRSREPKRSFRFSQFLPMAGMLGVMALGFFIGTIPALFVFVFAWLAVVEKYPLRFSLLVSAVSIFIVWLAFDKGVGVMFQPGLFAQ